MNFDTHFIFSYLSLLIIVISTEAEECIKSASSSCSCSTSKFTIDLTPLSTSTNPRFSVNAGGYNYSYQPCIGLQGGCASQQNTAVCQKDAAGKSEYNAGLQTSVIFSGDPALNTLQVKYTGPREIPPVRSSTINLVCDKATDGKFEYISETPPDSGKFFFQLNTRYACTNSAPVPDKGQHSLSTGSVLLILFFVFLVVYFVGGVLFLKFMRGAQGTEMIPNYEFWTVLPGLVKDGAMFTFRGCKTDASYSQI